MEIQHGSDKNCRGQWGPSTCTDLDLQIDFQGHLKVKLIFWIKKMNWTKKLI